MIDICSNDVRWGVKAILHNINQYPRHYSLALVILIDYWSTWVKAFWSLKYQTTIFSIRNTDIKATKNFPTMITGIPMNSDMDDIDHTIVIRYTPWTFLRPCIILFLCEDFTTFSYLEGQSMASVFFFSMKVKIPILSSLVIIWDQNSLTWVALTWHSS